MQAVTEILIATVTIHQLRQLTRKDPPSGVDLDTRPHGSASSPLSAPAQTTSHTHAARGVPAALSAAAQTLPSPMTYCRSSTAPRAMPPAHRPVVRVSFPLRQGLTVRRDAPPTGRCQRAR